MSTTSNSRGSTNPFRSHSSLTRNLPSYGSSEWKRPGTESAREPPKPRIRAKPKNFVTKQFDQPELEPTTEDIRRKSPYSSSFKFERSIFLGELGDGKLLKHSKNPSTSKVILKTFCPSTTKDRDQLIRQIKFYKQLDCASVLKVLDFEVRTESAYCSVNYFIDVYFEQFDKSLETAFKERQPSHMLFSNESLERLLYDVAFALHHYCKHNMMHGCIDARHVMVHEVEGEIVVAKLLPLIGLEESPLQLYRKSILFQTEHSVAPEIFDQAKLLFKDELDINDIDFLKLDSFSLGMLILRSALLEPVMKAYAKPTFDEHALEGYILSFEEVFGDGVEGAKLLSCVKSLLQLSFSKRPYPSELLQTLNSLGSQRLTQPPQFLNSQSKDRDSGSNIYFSRNVSETKVIPVMLRTARQGSQETDEPNRVLPPNFLGFHTVQPSDNPLHRKFAATGHSQEAISVRELSKDSQGLVNRSVEKQPNIGNPFAGVPLQNPSVPAAPPTHPSIQIPRLPTRTPEHSGYKGPASSRLPLVDMSLLDSARSLKTSAMMRYSATKHKSKYKTSPEKYAPLLQITPETFEPTNRHRRALQRKDCDSLRTNLFATQTLPDAHAYIQLGRETGGRTEPHKQQEWPLSARCAPAPNPLTSSFGAGVPVPQGALSSQLAGGYHSADSNVPRFRRSVSMHQFAWKPQDSEHKFLQQFANAPLKPELLIFPAQQEIAQVVPIQGKVGSNQEVPVPQGFKREMHQSHHRRSRTELPLSRLARQIEDSSKHSIMLVTPADEYFSNTRHENQSRTGSLSRLPEGTLDALLQPKSALIVEKIAQQFNEDAELIRSRSASERNRRGCSQEFTRNNLIDAQALDSGKSSILIPGMRPHVKSGDMSAGSDPYRAKYSGTQGSTRHPTDGKISLNIEPKEIGIKSAGQQDTVPVPAFWGRASYRSQEDAESQTLKGDQLISDQGNQTPLLKEPKTPPSSFGMFGRQSKPPAAGDPKSALQALLNKGRFHPNEQKPSQATTANATRIYHPADDSNPGVSPLPGNRFDSRERFLHDRNPHHSLSPSANTSEDISFIRGTLGPPGEPQTHGAASLNLSSSHKSPNPSRSLSPPPVAIPEEGTQTLDSGTSGPSAVVTGPTYRQTHGGNKDYGSHGTPSITPRGAPEEKAPHPENSYPQEGSGSRPLDRGWRKAESKVMDEPGQGSSEDTEEDVKRIRRELKERKLQYDSLREHIKEESNLSPEDIEAEIQRRLGELAEYFDKQLSFESDAEKSLKRNTYRESGSPDDSTKFDPNFMQKRPSPFKGLDTGFHKHRTLNDSKPIQIEPNYLIDKSQTMDPTAKSYVTPNWVDLDTKSPSPSQLEQNQEEQNDQNGSEQDELKNLIITRKASSSVMEDTDPEQEVSVDKSKRGSPVPLISLPLSAPSVPRPRDWDTPIFVRVRGPDEEKDEFEIPKRLPMMFPITGGSLLVPPSGAEVEPQILSARSIQMSPNKLLRPFLAAASPSPSKFKDRFTRMDQNNELEFLYAEYFAAD